jgi:FeS assembly SUF system protein
MSKDTPKRDKADLEECADEPAAEATGSSTDTTETPGMVLRDGPPSIEEQAIEVLKSVFDPEIPVNIYELGLIYEINVPEPAKLEVKMTLTAPGCPVAGTLPGEVEAKLAGIHGVEEAKVELVWEPAWTPERMTEEAKLELGFF